MVKVQFIALALDLMAVTSASKNGGLRRMHTLGDGVLGGIRPLFGNRQRHSVAKQVPQTKGGKQVPFLF